jgi:iron complex transport system substrate-binding protein
MRRITGRFARDVMRRAFRCAALGGAICGAALSIASARAATPMRIVSTSPSITETLFALGLGDRVVGVSAYCRFPAEALTLPNVGTFLKPDAELIAGLRPDLVLVHELSNGIDRRLTSLRIRSVVVDRGTLASVFSSIRQIAQAAGEPARGDSLVADIERRLQLVRRGAVGVAHPRVLFIIGRNPGMLSDLVAVGPGSYINDLIEIAGGRNVLAIEGQPEYPRISMETVLRLDPEVIVDTVDMGETEAERRLRQPVNERLWSTYGMLTAVKTHRLHAATTDALVVPGPRVVDAAEWVAALLRERSGR